MPQTPNIKRFEALTEREQTVLSLIADGMSNREIASHLSLSVNTVKWHTQQIYDKLGVERRTQAVAVGRSLGLIEEGAQHDSHYDAFAPPIPITRLIGREQELADLNNLLHSPDGRLITLLGPGGIGKTRLAEALAEQWQDSTSQPVVFVRLEGVSA